MKLRCTVMATALILALSSVAAAATLYTQGAFPGLNDTFVCSAINVGKKTRDVTIEIRDIGGTAIVGPNTQTLPPGNTVSQNTGNDFAWYCKIDFKGSKKNIRASVCIYSSDGCTLNLPAE